MIGFRAALSYSKFLLTNGQSTCRLRRMLTGGRCFSFFKDFGFPGGAHVDVPPGALESDARLTISTLLQLPSKVILPKSSAAAIYAINAGNAVLRRPASLTFPSAALSRLDSLPPDKDPPHLEVNYD